MTDETLRSAWRRLMRLWRPMAGWTLLVWAAVGIILGPISAWALGWQLLRGPRGVVGNEELFAWLLTAPGLAYVILAGSLAVMGAVVRYAGLFQMVTDDLEGQPVTVRQTALELAPRVPALFRLCLWGMAAGVALLVPLVVGLAGIHALLLGEHDINYYLAVRPAEWGWALSAATVWGAAWVFGAAWLTGRTLLALPAYLDGHRPARVAVRRAWKRTRGGGARLLRLLALSVGAWLVVRAGVDAAFFATASAVVEWVATVSAYLRPLVLVTGAYAAGSFALDAVVGFLGFSFVSTLLTKFYHEDTDLHSVAPPAPGLRQLGERAAASLRPWLRPARLLPLVALLAGASATLSGFLLNRLPEPRSAVITAHRAGPPPAPENTLAALERSIEAGADFSEIDVQRTRDGVTVLVHDADLMRVAGDPRRVAETDYDALAALVQRPDDGSPPEERRVVALRDFLERARGRIGVNIELKYYGRDPLLAEEVVRLVRETGMADQVVVMSLSLEGLQQVRRIAPEIPVGYVSTVSVGDLSRLPVDFLAVARPTATPRMLRAARERGMETHVWTVNRADVMADLIQRGVDGIITDDPALGARVNTELAALSPASRLLLRFRKLLVDIQEPARGTGEPRVTSAAAIDARGRAESIGRRSSWPSP